jgi:hypothetical protein
MADIKKFFGVTIPKPAVAALTPEQFFGGAKVAAAEVPFSSSSSSAPKAAAGGAGGPPGPAADAAAHRKTEEETVRHFKDALFALGEVFAKRLSYGVGGKGKVINRKVNVKLDQPGYWDEISPLAGYTVRVFSGESGPGRPSDFATANFRIDHEGGVHIMVTPYSDHSDTDVAMPAILQDLYLVGLGRELLTKGDSVKVIENDTTAMKGAIDSLRAFLAVGRPTKVEHTKFGYGSDKDSSNIIQFTMPAQTVGNTMSIHGKAMTIMSNMSEHVTVYVSATKIVIDHSWSSIYRTVTVEDTRDLTERILKNHPDTWRIVPIGTLHKHIAHLL